MIRKIHIRTFEENDIAGIGEVHKAAFTRQTMSHEWIEANCKAFPRIQYFLAETSDKAIVGYIQWIQKSGFRPEVVLELEQLAVLPELHGNGIATQLIKESLQQVQLQLASRGATIKHVIVTTRADNYAQILYQKTLGAEVEATLSNLYSADEVVMIARNISVAAL